MPKTPLTEAEKLLKHRVDTSLLNFISVVILIGFGIAMLVSPSTPERGNIERVSEAFINDIWGIPGGIGLILLFRPIRHCKLYH